MTVSQLQKTSQARLDDLFRAARCGPIPAGDARGTALIFPATRFTAAISGVIRVAMWKGKVFLRGPENPRHVIIQNKLFPWGWRMVEAAVVKGCSRLDGRECIVLDYAQRSFVANRIRDELRQIQPGVYLGKAYFGSRRLFDFILEFGKSAPL